MVDDATRKAQVLIEALPYMKRFHGRTMVVKIGGEPIENEPVLDALLTDLVFLEQVGVQLVLVHGGGASITRAMEAAGLKPVFHNGRRVTDAQAMAIVAREVERLNQHIVNRIISLGGAAIGMCPPRHMPVRGGIMDANLGLVGLPSSVDRERLERFTSRGLIPVVPPLSITDDGQVLNTNADDIALAVARGMNAEKLVFLSNVPGVLTDPKDPSTLISSLTTAKVRDLLEKKVIQGGMIPKVESCIAALKAGVGKIHILGANQPHAILLEIFTTAGVGTELSLGAAADDDDTIAPA
ncbi:MAG: acetylglutamate kinase [Planctomycetota bacterium]